VKPPKGRARFGWILAAIAVAMLCLVRPVSRLAVPPPKGRRIVLWHSQRGAEREVLEDLLRKFNAAHEGSVWVEPLGVPDATFKDKVRRSIPHGAGPDVFIRPHNEIGQLADADVVAPLSHDEVFPAERAYVKGVVAGVMDERGRYVGVPLTYKGLVQFYNTKLLPAGPPTELAEFEALRAKLPPGVYPLAYDATSLFFDSPFLLATNPRVRVFDDAGRYSIFDEPKSRDVFALPGQWKQKGILPPEVSYNEAARLFEAEEAAVFITGPWYSPGGAIRDSKDWAVAPLFRNGDAPGGSFVTVDTVFVSSSSAHRAAAVELAEWLASDEAQRERYARLGLPPVTARLYDELGSIEADGGDAARAMVLAQRRALEEGEVTPSTEKMGAVWNPALDVLSASVSGRDLDEAMRAARFTLTRVEASSATPVDGRIYGALLVGLLLAGTLLVVRQVRRDVATPDAARMRLLGFFGRVAVPYLAPGVVAVALLVVVPLVVSAGMSLFAYEHGRFVFVGMSNFKDILFVPRERAFEARSFYFALGVTVLWTLVNVTLHVAIGVALALLLRPSYLRFRTAYRLVLVLPWAIPNYITALVWKGMFHAQVGAINKLLSPFGFEGYNWFDHFGTAFFANVITNTWLGFPFMMVVTLGALAQIPTDLEEAATLDGASRWTRFTRIVLPHIRPALLPSILLGSVWTFNMFNVVYLVSGGEPGSETDILVSEAYRWAFERGERYGYAAAYSVLIFAFLLFYGRLTKRLEGKAA
jgi:arabinogalactan oligomer/maltooligosaccharide transport system permease protein